MTGQHPVSRDLPRHAWLWVGSCCHIQQLLQYSGMNPTGSHDLMNSQVIQPAPYNFCAQMESHCSCTCGRSALRSTTIIKGWGKKTHRIPQFFCIPICQGTIFNKYRPSVFLGSPLAINMFYKSFLDVEHTHWPFSTFSGLWPCVPSPIFVNICDLPGSSDLTSRYHPIFLSLSSKRSSLLSQAGLLSLLPDLWHRGMACSQTFQQWFFKTDQHSWRPQKHIPRGDCKVATWVAENLLSQNTQQKLCWTFFSLH